MNMYKSVTYTFINIKSWSYLGFFEVEGASSSPLSSVCHLLLFKPKRSNTVVLNRFHSVKIVLFPSARSRDFDGLIGIELPVSMYTTKTPIDLCRFNVQSKTLKNLSIFCKRQISIKLFYLYPRVQYRDNYFFKIKFVFFLYLRLSASKENDLTLCIYF